MSGFETASGVFLILLSFVVVFALLARRLQTPYPIVLVLAGLVLSLIPGTPDIELDPSFVFYVVLPPLLYAAAWVTSWRSFSHHLVSIVSLACGLVVFTLAGVALAIHWIFPGFDWRIGLILGAVVAPTDAIAATSIASRVGLPRRIADLLEGESLVNDATGLLALELGLAFVMGGTAPTLGAGLLRFAYLVVGGVGVGLAIAHAVSWLEQRIDDGPIEITISIMVPYAAYFAAETIHASGVLAVVACGLLLSRRSAKLFSPAVRLQMYAVWSSVVFILNGLVFVLIGLQLSKVGGALAGTSPSRLAAQAILFSILVIALRLVWVYPGARVAFFIRQRLLHQTEPRPTGRELFVVGWSGMRGVVALAAATALPLALPGGSPFPRRNLIVFLTFSVVISTLVLQGLSLAPLIRLLGLTSDLDPAHDLHEAQREALTDALAHLEEARAQDDAKYSDIYDDIAQHYRQKLEALARSPETADDELPLHYPKQRELSRALLSVQRRTLLRLRDAGRIDDRALRELERDLDLQEARFS